MVDEDIIDEKESTDWLIFFFINNNYLDLSENAINRDMQYPIIPGLTSPGKLGALDPELSDIAYPAWSHFPIDSSN